MPPSEAILIGLGRGLSLDTRRCPMGLLELGSPTAFDNRSLKSGLTPTDPATLTPESLRAGCRPNAGGDKTSRLGSERSGVFPNKACFNSGEVISSGLIVRVTTEPSDSFLIGAVLMANSGLLFVTPVSIGVRALNALTGEPGGLTNLDGGLREVSPVESSVEPGVKPAVGDAAVPVLGGCPTRELMSISGLDGLDRLDRLELLDIALPGRRGGMSLAKGASSSESDDEDDVEPDATVLLRGSSNVSNSKRGHKGLLQLNRIHVPPLTVGLEAASLTWRDGCKPSNVG